MKHRMIEQDIGKGISILAVIMAHGIAFTAGVDTVLRALIGCAMPFFFFVSGLNYHPGKGSYMEIMRKRAKQLLLPLVKYTVAILIILTIAYYFIEGIESSVSLLKAFVGLWLTNPVAGWLGLPSIGSFTGIQRVFEPYWFILYMFTAFAIFYAVADYALRDLKRFVSVVCGLMLVGILLDVFRIVLPWGIHVAPVLAAVLLMGAGFGTAKIYDSARHDKWETLNTVIAFAVMLSLGLCFPRAGQISGSGMVTKILGPAEVIYTVFYASVAAYYKLNFSKLLAGTGFFGKYLAWLGKNSLTIFSVHLVYMAVAKIIVGADLNASLAQVDKMNVKDLIAFALTLVLVSLHTLISNRIGRSMRVKKRDV